LEGERNLPSETAPTFVRAEAVCTVANLEVQFFLCDMSNFDGPGLMRGRVRQVAVAFFIGRGEV
jgi:hypothetical protein